MHTVIRGSAVAVAVILHKMTDRVDVWPILAEIPNKAKYVHTAFTNAYSLIVFCVCGSALCVCVSSRPRY